MTAPPQIADTDTDPVRSVAPTEPLPPIYVATVAATGSDEDSHQPPRRDVYSTTVPTTGYDPAVRS